MKLQIKYLSLCAFIKETKISFFPHDPGPSTFHIRPRTYHIWLADGDSPIDLVCAKLFSFPCANKNTRFSGLFRYCFNT